MSPAAFPTPLSRLAAVLFVVTAVLIVWFCLTPAIAPVGGGHIDKVEHFGAYLLLTLLGFAALARRSWRMLMGVLLLGVAVEALQAWLPTGRTASLGDVLANAGGAGSAWLGWTGLKRNRG